ncbi:hypothetical protein LUX57_47225 [Actinomadura madurae]|nr:hypothetical protein [Actinomadura madurae]MCP9971752.1 hypothetical protein [Actinomadura madurae]
MIGSPAGLRKAVAQAGGGPAPAPGTTNSGGTADAARTARPGARRA